MGISILYGKAFMELKTVGLTKVRFQNRRERFEYYSLANGVYGLLGANGAEKQR